MNVLDENILESQRQLLRNWRIAVRQIGHELGRKGMADEEIIPFLLRLQRPTLFTRDHGFFRADLVHKDYCLVRLATSALLAEITCEPKAAMAAILKGYSDALAAGGRPLPPSRRNCRRLQAPVSCRR